MVVAQRISSLMEFAMAGRQIWISYSWSGVSGKLKAKVHIESTDNVVPLHARTLMLQCLQPLRELQTEVVVDRGHCFSAGHAFANFWIEPAPDVGAVPATDVGAATGESSSETTIPLASQPQISSPGGDSGTVQAASSALPSTILRSSGLPLPDGCQWSTQDIEDAKARRREAKETLIERMATYERMKADPARYDPTSYPLNLVISPEAMKAAMHRVAKAESEAADARSRMMIMKDGVDMGDD